MVAITIGMLVVAALLALFLNITRNNRELAKANTQIENGRFAIQLLQNDLVHAGFWGELRPAAPTAIPDPCLAVGSWDAAYKANMLGVPVMGLQRQHIPQHVHHSFQPANQQRCSGSAPCKHLHVE
jgi:type IV pilus assembly protein PilW